MLLIVDSEQEQGQITVLAGDRGGRDTALDHLSVFFCCVWTEPDFVGLLSPEDPLLWLFKRLYPKGTQDSARLTAICAPVVLSLTPQWNFKSTPLSPDFDKNLKHCKLRTLCVNRFFLQRSEVSLSCISVKLSFLYFNKFGRAFQWKVQFIKNDLNGLNIYWWWQGPCFILAYEDPINLSLSLSRA